ncbi:hypothetical protein NDU88_007531 [Pleurodeles waltl]|uniref:Uncharacterized protein n=1 Tax=Pleurodeles waltl TaxID=8319 RepID=A0AAV7VQ10_PLEWA|nr:hypothetical protein NDU88_007531 [Pleurodeles waltl]
MESCTEAYHGTLKRTVSAQECPIDKSLRSGIKLFWSKEQELEGGSPRDLPDLTSKQDLLGWVQCNAEGRPPREWEVRETSSL